MNFIKESFSYKVTLLAGKALLIEGHKGLSAYTECEIIVRIKGGKLSIIGDCLQVVTINEDELFIEGKLQSVGVCK